MSNEQPPPAPDLAALGSDCYWRFQIERKTAEYVRRRDGFVVDRRPMTPDEITRQMRGGKPSAKENSMSATSSAEERNQALVGQKFPGTHLTLKRLDGQHASSGAFLGVFECDCGQIVNGLMVAEVKSGRRNYCSGACALRPAVADKPHKAKKVTARKAAKRTNGSEPPLILPPVKIRGGVSPTDIPSDRFLKSLERAAAAMRQAAVLVNLGWKEDVITALRQRADEIDELIYAPAAN